MTSKEMSCRFQLSTNISMAKGNTQVNSYGFICTNDEHEEKFDFFFCKRRLIPTRYVVRIA